MRETKLRFTESSWKLLQAEAEAQGISVSQFVRETAVSYAIFLRGRRGDAWQMEAMEKIIQRLREED